MADFYGKATIKGSAGAVIKQLDRDALLDGAVRGFTFVGSLRQIMVRLEAEPKDQSAVVGRVSVQCFVDFKDSELQAGPSMIYDLEMEIGDNGPWRLRVPKRFVEIDGLAVTEESRPGYLDLPPEFLVVDAPGELEQPSIDHSTMFVKTEIVEDPDQTFVELDATDRAVLNPVFRKALAIAHQNARDIGFALEPVVEDAASFVDELPRGRTKLPPKNGPSIGFSIT